MDIDTSSPSTRRHPRLRRVASVVGATALALPFAVAASVFPAEAAAGHTRQQTAVVRAVDWYTPGGYDYGYGYGGYGGYSPYGGGYSPYGGYSSPYSGYSTGSQTTTLSTDTSDATTAETVGLVDVTSDVVTSSGAGTEAGTGLVLGSDGLVVTNHHVIADATSTTVTVVATGETYTATVVGYDATHDVAVLQLADASGLATVTTGGNVTKGDAVVAVGDANGDGGTLTAAPGTVLKRRTSITVTEDDGSTAPLDKVIKVSSDVIPGDSGGALYNDDGEVVGMNVAASSGSVDTTGYIIPIARVLRVADRIIAAAG